jgi:ribonuclease HIII
MALVNVLISMTNMVLSRRFMKSNALLTIQIPIEKTSDFIAFYEHEKIMSNNPYVLFAARHDKMTILLYEKDHHGFRKAVFSGQGAATEATLWGEVASIPDTVKPKTTTGWQDLGPQIGSDEVGTGDFFGPIVVCATYFGLKHLPLLDQYRIGDSKAISDEQIRHLGPILSKKVPFSLLTVSNDKYNQLVNQGFNINKIKAWLHHSALHKLHKKHPRATIYVDQFCTPLQYAKYVSDHKDGRLDIIFQTKAENQYPSVAIASIIARYAFLNYMAKLESIYQNNFPFGAGAKVDQAAYEFTSKKGLDVTKTLVKNNFKNYQRLLESLNKKD